MHQRWKLKQARCFECKPFSSGVSKRMNIPPNPHESTTSCTSVIPATALPEAIHTIAVRNNLPISDLGSPYIVTIVDLLWVMEVSKKSLACLNEWDAATPRSESDAAMVVPTCSTLSSWLGFSSPSSRAASVERSNKLPSNHGRFLKQKSSSMPSSYLGSVAKLVKAPV